MKLPERAGRGISGSWPGLLLFVTGTLLRFHFAFYGIPFQFAELISRVVVLYDAVGLVHNLFVHHRVSGLRIRAGLGHDLNLAGFDQFVGQVKSFMERVADRDRSVVGQEKNFVFGAEIFDHPGANVAR